MVSFPCDDLGHLTLDLSARFPQRASLLRVGVFRFLHLRVGDPIYIALGL